MFTYIYLFIKKIYIFIYIFVKANDLITKVVQKKKR